MQLASNFGFEVEEIVPMKLDAFYISLLSEKYLTGHSNYFSSLFNGFKSNNFARKNKKEYSSLIFVLKAKKNENKAFWRVLSAFKQIVSNTIKIFQ